MLGLFYFCNTFSIHDESEIDTESDYSRYGVVWSLLCMGTKGPSQRDGFGEVLKTVSLFGILCQSSTDVRLQKEFVLEGVWS